MQTLQVDAGFKHAHIYHSTQPPHAEATKLLHPHHEGPAPPKANCTPRFPNDGGVWLSISAVAGAFWLEIHVPMPVYDADGEYDSVVEGY